MSASRTIQQSLPTSWIKKQQQQPTDNNTKKSEADDDVKDYPSSMHEDDDIDNEDNDDDDDEGKQLSLRCDVVPNSNNNNNNPAKLKCVKCFRAARKDCTGNLCIRCCTDENCVVHQEQRARAKWKEDVIAGITEIQQKAKHKRARAIPKKRFKEAAFRYMNDTVVLWDMRTVLEPSPPLQQSNDEQQTTTTTTFTTATTTTSSSSSAAMARYQSDLKVREEILRRSRKNNESHHGSATTNLRRNYCGTKKRFRSVMENLYQGSLD